jgi:hypothetical protein
MNSTREPDLFTSSLFGVLRCLSVEILTYPLGVIKIHQQCSNTPPIQTALRIFKEEGSMAFYKGAQFELAKATFKQCWHWPLITHLPSVFYPFSPSVQYGLTGMTIAFVDALVTTPLEKARIISAFRSRNTPLFDTFYKNAWDGVSIHFLKRATNWTTMLASQRYLREQYGKDHQLTLPELTGIGIQTALVVSTIGAPLDFAHTTRQALNLKFKKEVSKEAIKKWFRGMPLSFLSLTVHNIATAIVIEQLK